MISEYNPSTKNNDLIKRYVAKKAKLVGEMEAKVTPILVGLFEEAYQASSIYAPKASKLFKRQMIYLARSAPTAFPEVRDVLEQYKQNTGIVGSETKCFDALRMEFECAPFDDMFAAEYRSSLKVHAAVTTYEECMEVHLPELHFLELADLKVVAAKLDDYWREAVTWIKLRRTC